MVFGFITSALSASMGQPAPQGNGDVAVAAPAPAPALSRAEKAALEKAMTEQLVLQLKEMQPAAFIQLAEQGEGPVIDLLQQFAKSNNKATMIFTDNDAQYHQKGVNENGFAIDEEGKIVVKVSVLLNTIQRFVPLYARDFGRDMTGGARNFRQLLKYGRIRISAEWMGPVLHGIYNNLVEPEEGRGCEEALVARLATHLLHSIGATYIGSLNPGAKPFTLPGAPIPNFTGGLPWYALENGVDPTATVPPPPPPPAAMAPPGIDQPPALLAAMAPPVVNQPSVPAAFTPARPGSDGPLTPKSAINLAKATIGSLTGSLQHLEGTNATLVNTNATQASTIEHEAATNSANATVNANLSEALLLSEQEKQRLRAQLAALQSQGTAAASSSTDRETTAVSADAAPTKKSAKAPKSSKKVAKSAAQSIDPDLLVGGTIVGYKRWKAQIVSKKTKVTIMFYHGVAPNDAPNENDTSCVSAGSLEPFNEHKHFPKQVNE